jgi:hypothetical protein
MRKTSVCASAMRSAAARRGSLAPSPAIRRASAAASPASAGSASTDRLSPWRSALRATAALPADVRGPVLRAALIRLAAQMAALVIRTSNVLAFLFLAHACVRRNRNEPLAM